MDPITAALLGAAAGWIGGWLFGSSRAQEEIAALQGMLVELIELNRQREAEIQRLRNTVAQLEREIASVRASRGAVTRFFRWLAKEDPEVLERYQRMSDCEAQIAEIEADAAADAAVFDAEVQRLRGLYPTEMAELEARLS